MKTNESTPSNIIQYIGEIIKERQQKSLPTFYTISIEQYEKNTPVAEKEEGYENFKTQVLKYMGDYNLTAITVQLFSGKSRNVTTPFQTFKVPLKKENPAIFLGNAGKENTEIQQLESSIPVGRYYDEKFSLQMQIMRCEMEKLSLTEKISQVTERYEEKLKDQGLRNDEQIKRLQEQLEDKDNEIQELEKEIGNNEKQRHNSFGNLALGTIGARALEGFAKSGVGMGVLKGVLGQAGFETLQGHLAGIENEQKNIELEKTPSRIVSEPETNNNDPRQVALNYIQKIGQGLPDMYLRMLYDLVELTEKNIQDLQVLWKVAQQIKGQRGKAPVTDTQKKTPDNEQDESGQSNDNLNIIE